MAALNSDHGSLTFRSWRLLLALAFKPSTLPGATKATQQYTTPAGPKIPTTTTTKSPIGPGSGYLKPPTSTGTSKGTGKGTGTGTGTGTGAGTGTGNKPPTFTDVDNGDGTITRTYSDGSVEIFRGGRGAGVTTDTSTAELLRRDEANRIRDRGSTHPSRYSGS